MEKFIYKIEENNYENKCDFLIKENKKQMQASEDEFFAFAK